MDVTTDQNIIISIIIATYNSEKYISQCLESIINQTSKDFEVIIIDGQSTDKTVDIIKSYNQININFLSEKDKGVYDAWNKGLLMAKGEWIGFLGSDDILLPTCIENYIKFIKSNSIINHFNVINSNLNIVDSNLNIIGKVGHCYNWKNFQSNLVISHVMMLHHRSLFIKYGSFDINYKIVADSEFLLRNGSKIEGAYLDIVTANFRRGGISFSTKAIWETFLIKRKYTKRSSVLLACDALISMILFFRAKLKLKLIQK